MQRTITILLTHTLILIHAQPGICREMLTQTKDASQQLLPSVSQDKLAAHMKRFTRNPHPLGSSEQAEYAQHLAKTLRGGNLKIKTETFNAILPCRRSPKEPKCPTPTETLQGRNVIATSTGWQSCTLLLGGHYDTKWFSDFKFVGANDGGSSTALLIELANSISTWRSALTEKQQNALQKRWMACTLHFVFFDGEEARLDDWFEGEQRLGIVDHLYGSREFVAKHSPKRSVLKVNDSPPLDLAIIIDMIGHKKQNLLISQGSDLQAGAWLVQNRGDINLQMIPQQVEDDHVPFASAGLPFVHIIDITNMEEWHTPRDTLDIVSNAKIAALGNLLIRFLTEAPQKMNLLSDK